ncbi:MAG: cellobiose phosphorylase, partial [Rhodomicrobium sp.]
RVLAEIDGAWRLLTLPSRFEMGLSDCFWEYRHDGGTISVHVIASGEDPALHCAIEVAGAPCRFLAFGHLVLGEQDFAHSGIVEVDGVAKRLSFRPDPDWLWGQRYPDAVYHLVTSTPAAIDAIGGDELLYTDGVERGMPYVAFRTLPTNELRFAVTGSMTDAGEAQRLADKYTAGVELGEMLTSANAFWSRLTCNARFESSDPSVTAFNTIFPWLAHNAIVHLTVPHGLEQYSGGAWGTRDVCQGPIELFLALGHDEAAKDVLRRVFARQRRSDGDWPQWFFLEPYSFIQAADAHGDIIVWPLKAVCDYIEATDDVAFLSEPVAWGVGSGAGEAEERTSVAGHIEALLDGVTASFIPGAHLPRYGNGDWNDTLQPADLSLRAWLVSSWTSALFYQQLSRYVEVLRRAGSVADADRLSKLADEVRRDYNRYLIRDGVVAGYGLFHPDGGAPELLLHPGDRRTGISYSLIPMICAITGGLFTPEQAQQHLRLIREHLAFPDGVRLMDKPLPYHGGAERIFRRAESSPFFGREVGLMYTQAHLRFCEALAVLGDADGFWQALEIVTPIAMADAVPNACLRQRNCYFTSSDAAFRDRYEASAEWDRVRAGSVGVEAGWRIYSGGPGLFVDLLVRRAAGRRRRFGESVWASLGSAAGDSIVLETNADET